MDLYIQIKQAAYYAKNLRLKKNKYMILNMIYIFVVKAL